MMKLVGTDGTHYYSWNLAPGKYTLGRSSERDFYIPNKTVSRNHAEIEVLPTTDDYLLTDLNSRNGTTVNSEMIDSQVSIKAGDLIMFGQVEFKLIPSDTERDTKTHPSATILAGDEFEKSVVLSINEALQPLSTKITDLPDVLPTLFDMAKMLVLPEPDEVLLKRSLELVAKVIPAERLAVLYTPEDQDQIYPAATLLPKGKDPGSFTLSKTIVNEVMTNKNSVLIGDPHLDPRYSSKESIILSDLKAAMAVPLFDEEKVLGILYVDTTDPRHRYSDEYLRLLATFGNIIASRLSNNSLLKERQEKELMEAELKRAAKIQRTLLETDFPQLNDYQVYAFQEPSRQVGGDLYDLVRLDDGSLILMVADVSGKGMGAALFMSNILAAFRILYGTTEFDILRAVELVSAQMCKYSRSGDFATLFIGRLEPEKNKVSYVNAGHNAPLLVRNDGSIEYLEASGVMIGAFDFVGWECQTVELQSGDFLFVYTDGVTEAQTADEDMYSDERMEKLVAKCQKLSPEQIAGKLVADIREFVDDAPSSDDITMLILKRNS